MCRKKKYVHIYLFFICDKTSEVDFYVVQSLVMKIVSGRCSHLDLFSKSPEEICQIMHMLTKKLTTYEEQRKLLSFTCTGFFKASKKKKNV